MPLTYPSTFFQYLMFNMYFTPIRGVVGGGARETERAERDTLYPLSVYWERKDEKGRDLKLISIDQKNGLSSSSSKFRCNTKHLFPCREACVYSGKASRKSSSPVSAEEEPHLMTCLFQSTGATSSKNLH